MFDLTMFPSHQLAARPKNKTHGKTLLKIVAMSVGLVPACVVAGIMSYTHLNEAVEHHIFKGKINHGIWEMAGRQIQIPRATAGSSLIVYQHIPRTASDAMRTHLFRGISVDASPILSHQYPTNIATYMKPEHVAIASNASTKMIKGFFSSGDLARLNVRLNRTQHVVTFIRHPVERMLSLFHMVRPAVRYPNGSQYSMTASEFLLVSTNFTFGSDPSWQWGCSFTKNAMAWQLGDTQHCTMRMNLSNAEVLVRAKQSLRSAAFVGFYETLHDDFWRLKMEVLSEFSIPNYIPYAFWLGTLVGLPRLKVLRYSAHMAPGELKSLHELLSLDMDLYSWAREHFKPDLVLYQNYSAFFRAYFLEFLLVVLCCIAGCGGCCWLCCCCVQIRLDPKAR